VSVISNALLLKRWRPASAEPHSAMALERGGDNGETLQAPPVPAAKLTLQP